VMLTHLPHRNGSNERRDRRSDHAISIVRLQA